ncbi:hypothetical protein Hanom_Chr13g01203691 [Helianthus anomalus]
MEIKKRVSYHVEEMMKSCKSQQAYSPSAGASSNLVYKSCNHFLPISYHHT